MAAKIPAVAGPVYVTGSGETVMDEGPFVTGMLFGGTNDEGIGVNVYSVTPPGCCSYATVWEPNGDYIHSNFFDFMLGDSGYLRLYDSNSANKTTLFSIGLVGFYDYEPAMWTPDHRTFADLALQANAFN